MSAVQWSRDRVAIFRLPVIVVNHSTQLLTYDKNSFNDFSTEIFLFLMVLVFFSLFV